MVEYNSRLFAAGNFGTADGQPASLIAQWDDLPVSVPQMSFALDLAQNYPNPFNPVTTIEYSVNQESRVRLQVFDARGRLVRTLVNRAVLPNNYKVLWDGRDSSGNPVASGIYFYRMISDHFIATKKMILLK